jgi:hypothetical protein
MVVGSSEVLQEIVSAAKIWRDEGAKRWAKHPERWDHSSVVLTCMCFDLHANLAVC